MEYVFLYAGQGSQRTGMGADFYQEYEEYRQVIDSVDIKIGNRGLRQLMEEATLEELSDTSVTQPVMAAFGAGVTAVLKKKNIRPLAACGLSLGEYGALYAAGVFTAKTYVELVANRGAYMAEASAVTSFKMTAVLGLEAEQVEEICSRCLAYGYVKIVNYNCPGQYVIGGDEKAVLQAERLLKEAGAGRLVALKVSGPFHTAYMEPAAKRLEQYLKGIEFKKPCIPVCHNSIGGFAGENRNLKELLKDQIQNSVYFEQNLKTLLEAGYESFLEIGPGSTLSSFVKKTAAAMGKKIRVISIDKVADLKKLTP